MANFFTIALGILLMISVRTCMSYKNKTISHPQDKREVWMDSCLRAIDMSCYHADCAVLAIEQIQEKVCVIPYELQDPQPESEE